jgi:hypothetical protein
MLSSPHEDIPRAPQHPAPKQGRAAYLCSAVFRPTSGLAVGAFSVIAAMEDLTLAIGQRTTKT